MELGPDGSDTWARAAKAATFDYYELADPTPDQRWAGGYGHGDDGTTELDVLHRVDGNEVCVSTRVSYEWFTLEQALRFALNGLVLDSIAFGTGPLVLPQTVTLEAEDRLIRVEQSTVEFRGVRLSTSWAGVARMGGVDITVATRGGVPIHALEVCKDCDLPDRPPLD